MPGMETDPALGMFGRLRELVSVAIAEARAVAGEDPGVGGPVLYSAWSPVSRISACMPS